MDSFVVIGVCIACIGIGLLLFGIRDFRRSDVTPRDIDKWRTRAGKQSFSVPWNMPLDVVVAFVRAWRRRGASRTIGMGAAVFMFGAIVAIYNAHALTSAGEVGIALYQYLGIVLYPPIVIASYLGISSLSRHQVMTGHSYFQWPLRGFRHPVVPAMYIILLLIYVALLVFVIARLTRGFDTTLLTQVLAWPEMWGLFFGLGAMVVAIVVTDIVVRRIVALPPIPFPPANGWERLANYVLRFQALQECYTVALSVFIFTAFCTSSLTDERPLDQAGMGGWFEIYMLLVCVATMVFGLLMLLHVPSPPRASVDANPGTSSLTQQ